MSRVLASVATLLLTATLAAASDLPPLKEGASLQLLQTTKGTKPLPNGEPLTVTMEQPIRITVLKADASGALLRWSRGELKITDVDMAAVRANPSLKTVLISSIKAQSGGLMNICDNLSTNIRLNEKMEFAGIENVDECKAAIKKMFEGVDALRAQQGGKPIDQNFKEMTLKPEFMNTAFTKEFGLYMGVTGITLKKGETLTSEVTMPNPLGGQPWTGTLQATLEAAPASDGTLVVKTLRSVDPNTMVDSLKETIKKNPSAKPLSADDEKAMRQISTHLEGEYHVDPATGLPKWSHHFSKVTTPGGEQSEDYTWAVVPTTTQPTK